MVETVLSEDDVSEMSLLQDELIYTYQVQAKITHDVLDRFEN